MKSQKKKQCGSLFGYWGRKILNGYQKEMQANTTLVDTAGYLEQL